jgi:hypothetical protein
MLKQVNRFIESLALQKSPALIEYERVKKWDGQLPTAMIIGGGSSGGSSWGSLIQMRSIPREAS